MRVLPVVLVCVLMFGLALDAATASAVEPLTDAQVSAMVSAPTRHVRAVGRAMSSVLAEGIRRSETFAQLVLALDQSDVIVYIESGRGMSAAIAGRLFLAARPEGHRYLRIQVTGHPQSDEIIALVGHELRHALEVAEAPEVRDKASLIALYERIGRRVPAHTTTTPAPRRLSDAR